MKEEARQLAKKQSLEVQQYNQQKQHKSTLTRLTYHSVSLAEQLETLCTESNELVQSLKSREGELAELVQRQKDL